MVGAIVAGVALVKGANDNRKAREADESADIISDYQDDINYQMAQSDASVNAYNMTRDNISLTSQQQAVGSAMGKSITGGSAQAINREGQRTLNRDIQQGYDKAKFVKDSGELNKYTRRSTTATKDSARQSKTTTQGLLMASKMFA